MSNIVIKATDISKQYRLGLVGSGTLKDDMARFWAQIRGKEDPTLKVGQLNDRTQKSNSDYVWALKDINFEVKQGEILGIIGKNGAGKSTLLKILSKITAPTTGSIKIKGRIASLLEVGTGFHGELTGRENIYINGAILGMRRHEVTRKLDEIIDFAGVEKYIDTPVKRYSSGMTVRLGFAVAANLEPDILVIDEVLAVGDAEFQKKAIGKMQDVSRGEGRTILFVSHNMASIQNLCTRGILLNNGSIEYVNNDIRSVIERYLHIANQPVLDLKTVTNRIGNRKVMLNKFYVTNQEGKEVKAIFAGDNIYFVFELEVNDIDFKQLNIGFSLHDGNGDILSILYTSYQNYQFQIQEKGKLVVSCYLKEFPIGVKQVTIKTRIEVDKQHSDWVQVPVAQIDIEYGNYFYQSINNSFPILLRGDWDTQVTL
ncbi:ABC-type polysaccharide/polyol phosphate transport system, ATPase component [Bernardetia litoralis DSM 6794]|uniref:ABC-type polysaccharide/polyol phosphate transport system, ATPase component n=1 Tax=Bernardetia litoralis (strain ATCC 23117 / DSM 6794 / NBRC 15988 / NCIMB 1366 / Fx l1 / Sio-4) TaxID=880071 RepID=I4AFI9_BERLS|nr:ABC transporter ATP-binding protein [Bernardetia litoralis]AFM02724.1 ABC-type polysaccharide/polyol phosphate transport system, ATPase component [Bernardetia litoralis DSM 6794]